MTTSNRPPTADLIAAFEERLLALGSARAELRSLWGAWNEVDQAWAGQGEARGRLAHALHALEASGTITLPKSESRLWDKALPSLPARVMIPANRRGTTSMPDIAAEPWTPAMSWAPAWIRSTHPPLSVRLAAIQINTWLLSIFGQAPPRVAREERSLHIFEDEKRLATLADGALFATDERLTLDALHCDAPLGSLRIARLREQGPVLVIENKSTFDSTWRALKQEAPAGRYAAVVFGGGDAASTLVNDLLHLHELVGVEVESLHYAGDVDIAGVEAAHQFAQACASAGLQSAMAEPLWEAVAASRPTGEDLTAGPERTAPALKKASELRLPTSVHDRLREGVRVPQERIDRTALADTSWWAGT